MNSNSNSKRPTLAILPNWLGDVVMCVPALRALRAESELVGVGSAAMLGLLEDLGELDQSVVFERRGADAGLAGLIRAGRRLRRLRPARAVAFPPSLRAAVLAWLSGASQRTGFGGEGRELFLNDRRGRASRDRHLSEQWVELVGDSSPSKTPLSPGELARSRWRELREALPEEPKDFFVVAPGATYGPTKRWPEGHFVELARRWGGETNWAPVFIGSADAEERSLVSRVAMAAGGIDLAGQTDLSLLTAVLADAKLFVGNDSGPMHLAAALGTPTVGIFGSTSPAWTAPRGPRVRVAGPHPVECTPCFQPSCPIGIPCLVELGVDEVLAAARALHPSAAERSHG